MNAILEGNNLTPPQREVLECGLLTSGFHCVLQMPTGSGKTWLAEQAIAETLARGQRAVYLTPLRALATELMQRWKTRFAGTGVGVFTGDYGVSGKPYPVPFQKARLLVMTPERLDACTRAWRAHWKWLPEVDLLVVDELHLLGDGRRGAHLEGALSRMRRLNPFLRILGLSATLGNRGELADWLEGVEYVSDWRPIPLTWRIERYRKATEKPDLLVETVRRNLAEGGKSLVFVQSRRRAEELSRHLQAAGVRAQHHHAGLGQEERGQIEAGFRRGEAEALVATGTLEMGLNLPVRQVVLYDLQAFDGTDYRPLDVNTVWQRVGRAARPGQDTQGEAVLFAAAWESGTEAYAKGIFSPIRSALCSQRALAEQIVVEVASGLSRSGTQLRATFGQSLAAHQRSLPDVEALVRAMCDAGMIAEQREEEQGKTRHRLTATRLGKMAARQMLSPSTLLLFRKVTETLPELTFFDLLLLASCSEDCEPLLPVDFEELDDLAFALAQEPTWMLRRTQGEICDLLQVRGKRLLSAIKNALVARAWTRIASAEEVAERFGCYPFEVARLNESLERLLQALCALEPHPQPLSFARRGVEEPHSDALLQGENILLDASGGISLEERAYALCQMVRMGLDTEAVTLTLVPGIGPAWARRLCDGGIADIEALALAETEDVAALGNLSEKRAAQWISEAEKRLTDGGANRYREEAPTLAVVSPDWPTDIDPYRLRRALDLKVSGVDGNQMQVSGGQEPHQVWYTPEGYRCDCQDAAKGFLCKHVLAVRLQRGDRTLRALVRQLGAASAQGALDLHALWFEKLTHASGGRA